MHIDDVASEIADNSMPPTDEGLYQSLTSCERAMLDAWVAAGTPAATTVKVLDIAECKAK